MARNLDKNRDSIQSNFIYFSFDMGVQMKRAIFERILIKLCKEQESELWDPLQTFT